MRSSTPSIMSFESVFDVEQSDDIPLNTPQPPSSGLVPPPQIANHLSRSPSTEPLQRGDGWDHEELPSPRHVIFPYNFTLPLRFPRLEFLPKDNTESVNPPPDENSHFSKHLFRKVAACIALTFMNSATEALIDWLEVISGCSTEYEEITHGSCIGKAITGGLLLAMIGVFQIFAEAMLYHCLVDRVGRHGALLALFLGLPVSHLLFGISTELVGWAIAKHAASGPIELNAGRVLLTPFIGAGINVLLGGFVVFLCTK